MNPDHLENAKAPSSRALALSGYVYPAQTEKAEADRPRSTRRRSAIYFSALAIVAAAVAITQPAAFTIGMLVVLLVPAAFLNR